MSLKIIKRLRILLLGEVATATHVLTINESGDVVKVPYSGGSGGGINNIDGGSANSIELVTQNIDGGSATSVENGIIDGGNAFN